MRTPTRCMHRQMLASRSPIKRYALRDSWASGSQRMVALACKADSRSASWARVTLHKGINASSPSTQVACCSNCCQCCTASACLIGWHAPAATHRNSTQEGTVVGQLPMPAAAVSTTGTVPAAGLASIVLAAAGCAGTRPVGALCEHPAVGQAPHLNDQVRQSNDLQRVTQDRQQRDRHVSRSCVSASACCTPCGSCKSCA